MKKLINNENEGKIGLVSNKWKRFLRRRILYLFVKIGDNVKIANVLFLPKLMMNFVIYRFKLYCKNKNC